MNVFRIYLSHNFIKIYSKTHQVAPLKKTLSGQHAPGPPNKRMASERHANRSNSKINGPLMANPAYSHEIIIIWQ